MRFIQNIIPTAFSLVYPLYCPSCGNQRIEGKGWMCDDCWLSLPSPHLGGLALYDRFKTRVLAAFTYNDTCRELIHHMKFYGRRDIASEIGYRIYERLEESITARDITGIVPVPLHPVRIRERGYDQNVTIARSLSERLSAPIFDNLIKRIRNTPPQSRLSNEERLRNLEGAFTPAAQGKNRITGNLLLVDDVIHTGATAFECLKALSATGVRNTIILAAFA